MALDVTIDFDLAAAPGGTTTLTHTATIDTKGFAKLLNPLINRQLPRRTEGAVTGLKRLAESGG